MGEGAARRGGPPRLRAPLILDQLRGGMQHRVALARTMVNDPDLLLMDEPFAALDAQTREDMQELLIRVGEATSTHVLLFVTHDIEEGLPPSPTVSSFSVTVQRRSVPSSMSTFPARAPTRSLNPRFAEMRHRCPPAPGPARRDLASGPRVRQHPPRLARASRAARGRCCADSGGPGRRWARASGVVPGRACRGEQCAVCGVRVRDWISHGRRVIGWSFVFAGLLPDTFVGNGGCYRAPWWRQVMGRLGPARGTGVRAGRTEDHPVVHVSLRDARAFCRWSGPPAAHRPRMGARGTRRPRPKDFPVGGRPRARRRTPHERLARRVPIAQHRG